MKKITLWQMSQDIKSKGHVTLLYEDDDILCLLAKSNAERTDHDEHITSEVVTFAGCEQGNLCVQFADRTLEIQRGDILFVPPHTPIISISSSPDFSGYCLAMTYRLPLGMLRLDKGLQEVGFSLHRNRVIRLDECNTQVIQAYGTLLKSRQGSNRINRYRQEAARSIVRAIIYDLFAVIIETEKKEETSAAPLYSADHLFFRFSKMLLDRENISRKTQYYADQLCITPKYLAQICRKVSGKTATALINEAMTANIKYYLEYTDLSAKEIAQKLDFPNLSFFGSYVKRHLGLSPHAYRAALKER